jgi:capsid protein
MEYWNNIKALFSKSPEQRLPSQTMHKSKPAPAANMGTFRTLFTHTFNGEKNLGEVGPIKSYQIDYTALSLRAWQSYIESDISQTILNRFELWVIGAGLKLQAEPNKVVLKSEGLGDLDTQAFNEMVEARWSVWANSNVSDYSRMNNLHILTGKAFLNTLVSGDVLVILRYINDTVCVQLIDSAHVQAPTYGNEVFPTVLPNGNQIKNGIEFSPQGEHVAYYVKDYLNRFERIPAKPVDSDLVMAFMATGLEYRLDNTRGIPKISTVLETIAKLDRYKEATVGSAEERQKIAYSIEHEAFSDGSSPVLEMIAKARDVDGNNDKLPEDSRGNQLADKVAATTNKMTFNMTPGAHLKSLESKNELHFKDFHNTNRDDVSSTVGIPPEVAMSKYDSNFSASRAALKDWEHTLNVARKKFAFKFLQKIYNFWLETEILKNKIQAPGYIIAKLKYNWMVLEAYRTVRFVGPSVPHIDPLKEVAAERLKLGDTGASLPLTTLEQATESLNGGESDSNMEQYALELEESKKLKIEVPLIKKEPPVS